MTPVVPRRFEGKVVVVAGGSGGVGSATVRRVAAEGATVVVLYRTREKVAESLVEEIAKGGRALACQADLAVPGEADRAVAAAIDAFGRVDAFISTVGTTSHWDEFLDMDEQLIDRTIDVELRATMRCTRAALRPMVAQRSGRIVLVGSDSGKVGAWGEAASAAARGGIIAFAKTITREYARHEVTINVICPGPVETELWHTFADSGLERAEKVAKGLVRATPMHRPATPEEIANVAAFLASDDASFVTGQAISVSGGLTMS